ncbi:MAG: nucleotide exchange factor GrpE [Candidatus Bathyarchaeia archaeon]
MLPAAVGEIDKKAPSDREFPPEKVPEAQGKGNSSSRSEEPSLEQLKEEIEALRGELREEKAKAERYLTQLKYLQSDYESLKRRQAKEIEAAIAFGNEKLMKDLLSVLDELEMAVKAGKQGLGKGRNDSILEGVEMTLKRLYETLSREGLAKIEAVGRTFDPQLHEAAEGVFTKDYPEGTIIEEIRVGFTFKGKVIRPSVVKVAMNPKPNQNPGQNPGQNQNSNLNPKVPSCEGKPGVEVEVEVGGSHE